VNESQLKRYLLRSLRAQGGRGFRMEDQFRVGTPDCLMVLRGGPGFLIEVKIVRGAMLRCTEQQAMNLADFDQRPGFFAAIVGWNERREALYIGRPRQKLVECRYVPRPSKLDSSEWRIAELLGKFRYDQIRTEYHDIPDPRPDRGLAPV
jgi:Holliday junction resolvase